MQGWFSRAVFLGVRVDRAKEEILVPLYGDATSKLRTFCTAAGRKIIFITIERSLNRQVHPTFRRWGSRAQMVE